MPLIKNGQTVEDSFETITDDAPCFVKEVLGKLAAGLGDELPVSAFPNDGTFPTAPDFTLASGLTDPAGIALADLDNDGDLDLVISNVDDTPTLLENRQKTGNHWAGFRLRKEGANPLCIGARVTVEAGGRRQMREVRSGGGYLSQSDLRVLFGLGSYAGSFNVEVRLGQERWRFDGRSPDRYETLLLRSAEHLSGP